MREILNLPVDSSYQIVRANITLPAVQPVPVGQREGLGGSEVLLGDGIQLHLEPHEVVAVPREESGSVVREIKNVVFRRTLLHRSVHHGAAGSVDVHEDEEVVDRHIVEGGTEWHRVRVVGGGAVQHNPVGGQLLCQLQHVAKNAALSCGQPQSVTADSQRSLFGAVCPSPSRAAQVTCEAPEIAAAAASELEEADWPIQAVILNQLGRREVSLRRNWTQGNTSPAGRTSTVIRAARGSGKSGVGGTHARKLGRNRSDRCPEDEEDEDGDRLHCVTPIVSYAALWPEDGN